MAQAVFNFPRGFLWGTATASHQVEGNNQNNNWSEWEKRPGKIVHGHRAGLACDWWAGRWREDFDRAAESGQNAHRFSLEWSRIQPAPDRWDEDAVDHYREMLRGLHERGMTALVTLQHFTVPIWFEELGGWENDEAVRFFEAYVRKCVEALKEYCNLWVTVNEPNVLVYAGYLLGVFPPGKKDLKAAIKALANLVRAHAAAYRTIHQVQPQARVGVSHYYRSSLPARPWFPFDRLAASAMAVAFNDSFPKALLQGVLRLPMYRQRIPEARGTQDFLGIDYYTRDYVAFDILRLKDFFMRRFYREGSQLSHTGFIACEPHGLFEVLKKCRKFNLPIIILENGVEDPHDRLRPSYLALHLHQLWRAVNFNWPVKGYFHWTLVDNFEWERGWTQRFGLWELDINTQGRRKRPSADLYARVCQENALSAEVISQYCPDVSDTLFP